MRITIWVSEGKSKGDMNLMMLRLCSLLFRCIQGSIEMSRRSHSDVKANESVQVFSTGNTIWQILPCSCISVEWAQFHATLFSNLVTTSHATSVALVAIMSHTSLRSIVLIVFIGHRDEMLPTQQPETMTYRNAGVYQTPKPKRLSVVFSVQGPTTTGHSAQCAKCVLQLLSMLCSFGNL